LLERAAGGGRLSYDEGLQLYREANLHELGAAAHARRTQMFPGDEVTYVIDTTINYTNICNVHCSFCAFFRPEGHPEGYTMTHEHVLERVKFAADQGATQIMIQGGVNPDLAIDYYVDLFHKVRERFPDVDIHSLSTSEICGIAKRENMSVEEVLRTLRAAGLKSLPGAGAEILVERVRKEQDSIGGICEIVAAGIPVGLGEPPGRVPLDELLDVGGVAAEQPRQAGIILAPFLDQARERRPCVSISHIHPL